MTVEFGNKSRKKLFSFFQMIISICDWMQEWRAVGSTSTWWRRATKQRSQPTTRPNDRSGSRQSTVQPVSHISRSHLPINLRKWPTHNCPKSRVVSICISCCKYNCQFASCSVTLHEIWKKNSSCRNITLLCPQPFQNCWKWSIGPLVSSPARQRLLPTRT